MRNATGIRIIRIGGASKFRARNIPGVRGFIGSSCVTGIMPAAIEIIAGRLPPAGEARALFGKSEE
jgi:hypothetical protein